MTFVPARDEFLRLAADATVIPVYREVIADTDTPVSALAKLGSSRFAFLLESVEGGDTLGRYSFLGNSAMMTFRSCGSDVVIVHADGREQRETVPDALGRLEELLEQFRPAQVAGLPRFYGGAVGYIGYEAVTSFGPGRKHPAVASTSGDLPDMYFLITDAVLVFDHVRRKIQIVVNTIPGDDAGEVYDAACRRIEDIIQRLHGEVGLRPLADVGSGVLPLDFHANGTKEQFRRAVSKAQRYVQNGDVFQVVLSQRFTTPLRSRPMDVYRVLRSVNPSPYMLFLDFGDTQLIGSSPELMVRLENGRAELRPIAGTRRRGVTEADDERLAMELLADDKERAEHMMLVDLGRSDLGRVCRYGSVQVRRLMAVEKYSHVMHIVSDVTGELAEGRSAFDLLRAAFPAGTVSGAPKARAMEIIAALEPARRGPYAGAVGYFGFSGNMDSCIAIRTIVVHEGVARVQAGAGIVADSDPDREFQEIMSKAEALMQTIALSEGMGL